MVTREPDQSPMRARKISWSISMTEDQKRAISHAAHDAKMSFSKFVVETVLSVINTVEDKPP